MSDDNISPEKIKQLESKRNHLLSRMDESWARITENEKDIQTILRRNKILPEDHDLLIAALCVVRGEILYRGYDRMLEELKC